MSRTSSAPRTRAARFKKPTRITIAGRKPVKLSTSGAQVRLITLTSRVRFAGVLFAGSSREKVT